MIKAKLMAIIAGATSVTVAATTALTLAISGSRTTMSLHTLSDNEAVAYGITNLLDSSTSGFDTVTDIIEEMSSNKTALSAGFTLNEIPGSEELSGFGGNITIQSDGDNSRGSVLADVYLQSVKLFNASMYVDEKGVMASIPALFDGILSVPLNNLTEDFENSYIGSLLLGEGVDVEQYLFMLDIITNELEANLPSIDFDVADFTEGLTDTMRSSFFEAIESMSLTDYGKQALTGGKYQCYTAYLPVEDMSYVIKDAIMYVLNNDDFANLVDELTSYASDLMGDDSGDFDSFYSFSMSSQLSSVAMMIDSYWSMVISELKAVLGDSIELTLYLTDAAEMAGFEFYVSANEDGTFNFSKNAAKNADQVVSIVADYTGGKNINDYTHITLTASEQGDEIAMLDLSYKLEANGDLTLDITGTEYGTSMGLIHMDGSYKEDGIYFDLDIDSFSITDEYDETMFDVGFSISFKEIDAITTPSGSKVYNIWEMDESDFEELGEEIADKASALGNLFN